MSAKTARMIVRRMVGMTVIAPEDVRDYEPVAFKDEDPKLAAKRNAIMEAVLEKAGFRKTGRRG